MTIGLGILGCGGIARQAHIPSLAGIRKARVVALADTDPSALAAAQLLAPGARAFSDADEMLEMPDVDAVIIASPPALHAQVAIAALERGKHIYIEKPLAPSAADARRVIAAWDGSGLIAMMGFNYRRNPIVQDVRERIARGAIGEIIGVRTAFTTPPRAAPSWKSERAAGGGALLDLGVHHIDLACYLLATDVAEVAARVRSVRSEDDTAFLHLRLTNACEVQSFFSLGAAEADRVELFGERGALTIDRYERLSAGISPAVAGGALGGVLGQLARDITALPYALRKRRAPLHEPSFPAAMEAFVAAVDGRATVHPDLRDGLRTLEVVEAAELAARSGSIVVMNERTMGGALTRTDGHVIRR